MIKFICLILIPLIFGFKFTDQHHTTLSLDQINFPITYKTYGNCESKDPKTIIWVMDKLEQSTEFKILFNDVKQASHACYYLTNNEIVDHEFNRIPIAKEMTLWSDFCQQIITAEDKIIIYLGDTQLSWESTKNYCDFNKLTVT